MPIFCLDYAQIGTPFGEKSHNGTLVSNTAILHKSYDTSGWENICKRVWKMHPPRNADQKSGFPGTKPPLCELQVQAVFREVRTAQRAWDGAVFSLKAGQKRGYFYEVRTLSLYNPHGFWV